MNNRFKQASAIILKFNRYIAALCKKYTMVNC